MVEHRHACHLVGAEARFVWRLEFVNVELRGGVSGWSYSGGSREHRPYLGVTLYRAL